MKRFFASCSACAWEGQEADTPEVAAELGVTHLASGHPAVLQNGDVSFVRVWSFDKLRIVVGTADITLEPETEQPAQVAAEEHEPEKQTEHKAHQSGKKGR